MFTGIFSGRPRHVRGHGDALPGVEGGAATEARNRGRRGRPLMVAMCEAPKKVEIHDLPVMSRGSRGVSSPQREAEDEYILPFFPPSSWISNKGWLEIDV